MPGNPITGRSGMVSDVGIAVQALEWAFVGLAASIIAYESKMKRLDKKTASDAA
jgi:hypothetical protein